MKKIIAFLLAMIFLFGCVACSGGEKPPTSTPNGSQNKPTDNPGGDLEDDTDDNEDNKDQENNQIMLPMPNVRPKPNDPVGDVGKQPREIDAVLTVARAYIARTTATQYEDSKMTSAGEYWFMKGKSKDVDPNKYSPESATSQFTYYQSCGGFVKDVFLIAWGEELFQPLTLTSAQVTQVKEYSYWRYDAPTGEETAEEKERIKNEFLTTLKPGDIISTQKKGASGHILIYLGNGWAAHCTNYKDLGGGDYDQSKNAPKIEVNGSVEYYDITKFFEKGQKYDFWAYAAWSIIRPTTYLKDIKVTEQTAARMKNLVDIYVEKISSHPIGTAAQIGEQITYGIYIRNDRDEKATVELKDVVPANTTYVSGAEKLDGDNMSWSVKLEPGEEKMICYTVKVNEDPALYDNGVIVSDKATAGGVTLPCNNIYITKKLDEESCRRIDKACQNLASSDLRGIALARWIYMKSGLEIDLDDADKLIASLFVNSGGYKLNQNSEYYKIVVPTLYGGYYTKGNDDKKGDRNQFIDYVLMTGDILVCKEGSTIRAYMCVGEGKIIDLNASQPKVCEGKEYEKIVYSVYGQDVYAVLRPCNK